MWFAHLAVRFASHWNDANAQSSPLQYPSALPVELPAVQLIDGAHQPQPVVAVQVPQPVCISHSPMLHWSGVKTRGHDVEVALHIDVNGHHPHTPVIVHALHES